MLGETGPSLAGIKVLLAEDSPDNQVLIRRFLEIAGATVRVVANGQEAVTAARGSADDVILMDVQMPVMNGYEATKTLRDGGYTKPIVMLTAESSRGSQERAFTSGCSGYLFKPINRSELVNTIRRLHDEAAQPPIFMS